MSYTSAKRVLRFVAHYYDQPLDELMVRGGKTQPLAQQRHIAMWLIRNDTDLSYPSIGNVFGGRDHATIMYGVKRVNALLKANTRAADTARQDITAIRRLLATGLPSPLQAQMSVRRDSVPA
jgi:chromosomal replication initiator protein